MNNLMATYKERIRKIDSQSKDNKSHSSFSINDYSFFSNKSRKLPGINTENSANKDRIDLYDNEKSTRKNDNHADNYENVNSKGFAGENIFQNTNNQKKTNAQADSLNTLSKSYGTNKATVNQVSPKISRGGYKKPERGHLNTPLSSVPPKKSSFIDQVVNRFKSKPASNFKTSTELSRKQIAKYSNGYRSSMFSDPTIPRNEMSGLKKCIKLTQQVKDKKQRQIEIQNTAASLNLLSSKKPTPSLPKNSELVTKSKAITLSSSEDTTSNPTTINSEKVNSKNNT